MDVLSFLAGLAGLALVLFLSFPIFWFFGAVLTWIACFGFVVLPLLLGLGGGLVAGVTGNRPLSNVLVLVGIGTTVPWFRHLQNSAGKCRCPLHTISDALCKAHGWFR